MLRQFAAASFEVGGGDVVEQQRAVFQVPAGQLGFDERLLTAQPVERDIDLLGGDAAQPQRLAQRMAGGGGIQHPRRRQLGCRLEQPRDDQGQRQIAAALRPPARQQRVEGDVARFHVANESMHVSQCRPYGPVTHRNAIDGEHLVYSRTHFRKRRAEVAC